MSNRNLIIDKTSQLFFAIYAVIVLMSLFSALLLDELLWVGLPAFLLLIFQALANYKTIYFFLWACVPLSTEFYFSSSLATDLPTEPLIVGLMLVYLLQVLLNPKRIDGYFWKHPISLLVLFHLVWILFTTVVSYNVEVSIKFTLAKFWYMVTFFFLTGHVIRSEKQIRKVLWLVAIPLVLVTLKVLAHHYTLNFAFQEVNATVVPFFRNHVNYAAMLTLFIPLVWFMRKGYPTFSKAHLGMGGILLLLLIGVALAYTRAAYVALIVSVVAYWVIRFRLIRWVLLGTSISLIGVFAYMVKDNKFVSYAPSDRTIAHEELGAIVSATSKLEDVSIMERYYRWIAGLRMSRREITTGYGPGNFYNYYKGYTLYKFETYVSDNPERSGIHNYYLMTLVEQGIIGLLLFVSLSFFALIKGEQIYHQCANSFRKDIVMAMLLSLVIINAFLLINDMIETDKVGSFFFFYLAMFVTFDLWNKQNQKQTDVTEGVPDA